MLELNVLRLELNFKLFCLPQTYNFILSFGIMGSFPCVREGFKKCYELLNLKQKDGQIKKKIERLIAIKNRRSGTRSRTDCKNTM